MESAVSSHATGSTRSRFFWAVYFSSEVICQIMKNVVIIFLLLILGIGGWVYYTKKEQIQNQPVDQVDKPVQKPSGTPTKKTTKPKTKPKPAAKATISLPEGAAAVYVNGERLSGDQQVSAGDVVVSSWDGSSYSLETLKVEAGEKITPNLKSKKASPSTSWNTFQGNNERTSFADSPDRSSLEVVWQTELKDSVKSSPIVVNNTAYFSTAASLVTAVDLQSGEVTWTKGKLGSDISPIVNSDFVFAGSDAGVFSAFKQKNGKMRGEKGLNSYPTSMGMISNEAFLVATRENKVFSIATKKRFTGFLPLKILWEADISELWQGGSSPVILQDRAIYQTQAEGLVALSLKTGKKLWPNNAGASSDQVVQMQGNVAEGGQMIWNIDDGTHFLTSTPAAQDGVVYALHGERVYAVKAENGEEIWSVEQGVGGSTSVSLAYGMIFFGTVDGSLRAFNCKDGTPVYSRQLSKKPIFSSPVVFSGKILLGTAEGKLHLLDAFSGKEVAQSDALKGSDIFATPSVDSERILAVNKKGRLVCFK